MSGTAPISGQGAIDLTGTKNAKFSENMFLDLLVTQLRTQNPMEPMDNNSFMEQMSTFSSMEQSKEMNESLLKLLQFQGLLARMQGLDQASHLLGKIVEFEDGEGAKGSGEVKGVQIKDGEILLDLGGKTVPMSDVTAIREKPDKGDNNSQKKSGDEKGNKK